MAARAVKPYQQPASGLDSWAQSLPDAFIQCRDFGHTWRPWQAWLTGEHTYSRTLRCERCTTERRQELSVSGHTLSSSYAYAEGYQAPEGTGHLDTADRDVLRLASTLRLINESGAKHGAKAGNVDNVRPMRGRGKGPTRNASARQPGRAATQTSGPVRRAPRKTS